MAQSRINARIEAAIKRAARRYQTGSFLFTASDVSVALDAVKRDADADALPPISGSASARRYELVLTRRSFDLVASAFLSSPKASTASVFETLRKGKITSTDSTGKTTEYRVDAARPLQENSPDGGSVRLFIYEV